MAAANAVPCLIEDDGTLLLVRTATENGALHAFADMLDEQLPKANATLQFAHLLTSEQGAVAFSDPAQRARFAMQSKRDLLGVLETLQRHVEKSDSIDFTRLAGEVRMARKALVRFTQTAQETLERAHEQVAALLRVIGDHADADDALAAKRPRTRGADEEVSLQEKYRHAFQQQKSQEQHVPEVAAKSAEAARKQGDAAGESGLEAELKPIVVKYQGRGERPPPSDNLYVKGLPGFVTEEDIEIIFSKVGKIMSQRLKTAEWGAIAFVRMANRTEASDAIERLHDTVPEQLRVALERQHKAAKPAPQAAAAAASTPEFDSAMGVSTEAGMRCLQRLVFVRMDTSQPLGAVFDDACLAREVTVGSQAARMGMTAGASVKAFGGKAITKGTEQLARLIKKAKRRGLREAVVGYSPAPLHAIFPARPFGLAIRLDEALGLFVIGEAEGQAKELGVARGMALVAINGAELTGFTLDQCFQCLKEAALPCRLVFRQVPKGGAAVDPAPEEATVLSSDDGGVDDDDDGARPDFAKGVAPAAVSASFRMDLSKPLGIFFGAECVVERVGPGSQADVLGVPAGARARELAGETLPTATEELVKRVGAAKAAGVKELVLTFALPVGEAPPLGLVAAFEVDLSKPLGIFFDKRCVAERFGDDSQAVSLGIPVGARALRVAGEAVPNGRTEELVKRVMSAKKAGAKTVAVAFALPPPAGGVPVSNGGLAPSGPDAGTKLQAVEAAREMPRVGMNQRVAASTAAETHPVHALQEFRMDLSKPLGIFFDKECVAERIDTGSQAESLGVPPGARAEAVDGVAIEPRSTTELVRRVGAAKKAGMNSLLLGMRLPMSVATSDEEAPRATAEGAELLRSLWRVNVDLSRPLGVFFDKECSAERIGEASQAAELRIPVGAQVHEVGGEPLPRRTEELVKRIGAAKKAGSKEIALGIALPELFVTFDERHLPFSTALDRLRGVFLVREVSGDGAQRGVEVGMALSTVAGEGVEGRSEAELSRLLAECALPVRLAFRRVPPSSGR